MLKTGTDKRLLYFHQRGAMVAVLGLGQNGGPYEAVFQGFAGEQVVNTPAQVFSP